MKIPENTISGRHRVIVENVRPQLDQGRFPVKRVVGETLAVSADIFVDGHDILTAVLMYRRREDSTWTEVPMTDLGNDLWEGTFKPPAEGSYYYTVEAWVDHFATWAHDFKKRVDAGQDPSVQLKVGALLVEAAAARARGKAAKELAAAAVKLTGRVTAKSRIALALSEDLAALMSGAPDRSFSTRFARDLTVIVERKKILFSAWYERFPRSCSPKPGAHGTFRDCVAILPEIARMGFDVWYLPPIHPIGEKNRKGKNNAPKSKPGDVGSPWAIGSAKGGHKAIHPELGTMKDFEHLVSEAKKLGIDIALDIAFQCAPDHPYVKSNPEWFKWLPDGTVQHAENPPKKYEDILPFNFETEKWESLWEELKSVVLFWAGKGVRVFRVDNPHTKPFPFWEWLIAQCRKVHPELIFLSEAFTRPKVMYELAKCGFSQSYTYFTWRNTKPEIQEYMTHLLNTEVREFFKPNFWPNTPDILPEHLQIDGREMFAVRFLMAATLSSNYGIYGPAFELCVSKPLPGREEYADSEKYAIAKWDWDAPGNLKPLITRVNAIRREHEALQTTWNLKFHDVDNENLMFYVKANEDLTDIIMVVVNLDPKHVQSGWVTVPIAALGITAEQTYLVHDLLDDEKYIWNGARNFVQLDPAHSPGHVFHVRKRMRRETDFDYYY
jgi:starch synthase (maltosyl-transferring)